ncbi:major facilitator superfamily transporter [Fusarium albosuccineum]|uniref:Major facilitator superfamily transporter n=1 Tax=Fusarium albosuccineum TaxID=1237068 RepID=A0A8H4P747_9HYPO|nr:major facilitator superfamily transporter [Fusarium albosuccineum]
MEITDSRAGPKHEAQPGFKQSTVPAARFWALSVGVCLGLFLSIIDTSIVATSIYIIGIEFQDVRRVNWVALAYTLSYLGCAMTFARVSDVVGRRNAFVAAYVVFFIFSLACGFAQNLDQLIACRTLQGIGGSGLYSLPMIILPELCPEHLRQHITSIIGLVIAGSGSLGPILGGALTHYATWRWVFWINGPIGFVSLIIFFLSWPKVEHLPSTTNRSWKEFDYIGSFLIIAAAVLVVFPFQNAGESPGTTWGTAVFIAPLTIGLVLWLVLLAWGYLAGHVFKDNLALTFPINLFHSRAYAAAAISTLFLGYPYFMITYAFPLRAQVVDDKSPMMVGIMLLPMLGSTAVGSILAGALSKTKNYLFETMLAGACLMALGTGLLTIVLSAGDDAKALAFTVFAGLGFGLNVASATMLTAVEVPIIDYGKFYQRPPKSVKSPS